MVDIEKLDDELYGVKYQIRKGRKQVNSLEDIWNKIKDDKEVL